MNQFNRRQWLKTASATGAFTFLGGLKALAGSDLEVAQRVSTIPPDVMVRLSSNENPYGPSEKVKNAIIEAFKEACRYPFAFENELVTRLAQKHGVTPDCIVLAAGSTEGLKIGGLTYGLNGGEIIAAEPVFDALMNYAEQFGAHIHRVPLNDKLEHDLEAMEKRMTGNTRLVFICNPGNPSGTIVDASQLRDFCGSVSKRVVVFSDEAYYDYIEQPNYPSMVELVKQGMNVIVSRTFSKVYGMAGIRIGYLIARPDIASRLNQNTVANASVPAIFGALAALEDQEFYKFSIQKNKEGKTLIYKTLDELKLHYTPSHTNFVFFKTGRSIQGLIGEMRAKNVQIGRPFPPLLDWCRISTGRVEEVKQFTTALKEVMG